MALCSSRRYEQVSKTKLSNPGRRSGPGVPRLAQQGLGVGEGCLCPCCLQRSPRPLGVTTHWPPRRDRPWRGCLRISGEKAWFLGGRHVVHVGRGQILTWCDSGHLLLQITSVGVRQALTAQHSVPALLLLSRSPPVPLCRVYVTSWRPSLPEGCFLCVPHQGGRAIPPIRPS